MFGIMSNFRRQQGIDGNTTELRASVNAGYCTKFIKWEFFACMNKLPHQIVSVDKYTGLAMFCATELNSAAQKRKVWVGYMALSYNSQDTTGHSKMRN